MAAGRIDANLEAHLELSVRSGSTFRNIEFLLDTGFNGYLSVTPSLVKSRGLELQDAQSGITADGRIGYFATVDLTFLWQGRETTVRAQILDEAMLGTRMLKDCELHAEWIVDGVVSINAR